MVLCNDGCAAGLTCGRRGGQAPAAAKEEKQALQGPEPTAAEAGSEQRDEAADIELLNRFSRLRAAGKISELRSLLAEDARWVTLYRKSLEGSEEICAWLRSEREKGRANISESPWRVDGEKYSRELTTKFPRGGHHEVNQSAVISRGCIQEIKVVPRLAAHALVIDFALALDQGDDKLVLEKMDRNVVWKAWDNAEATGKSAVAELLAEKRRQGEKREGTSDFEVCGEVTDHVGIFERSVDIQGKDGARVNGTQSITVRFNGGRWKVTEVYVNPEAELQGGRWVAPAEREKSAPALKPAGPEDGKGNPKCGCAVM